MSELEDIFKNLSKEQEKKVSKPKKHKKILDTTPKPRKKPPKKPDISPALTQKLIKIQEQHTELLQEIVESLKSRSIESAPINIESIEKIIEDKISGISLSTPGFKQVTELKEVKVLIKRYIKGEMPNDKLASGRTHRTFRIGDFIKRMRNQWNIIMEREVVEKAKKELEADGSILPTAAAGKNTRYVLKEFINDYVNKLTKKDESIYKWLKLRSKFLNKDFTKEFYSKISPKWPSDHDWRSANRKLKTLENRNWIRSIPETRPKEFKINKEII